MGEHLLGTTKDLLLWLKPLAAICKSTAVALRLSLQAAFSHLRLLPKSPALGLLLKRPAGLCGCCSIGLPWGSSDKRPALPTKDP